MRTSQRTPNSGVQFPPTRKSQATGINTSINAVADATFCRLRTSSPRQLRLCLERVTETIHCEFYCLIKLRSDHTGPHYPRTTVTPHYAHGARRVHTTRPCRAETPLSGSWCPLAHREAQIVSWADSRHQNSCLLEVQVGPAREFHWHFTCGGRTCTN